MTKVVKFTPAVTPEKFGLQRARKKKGTGYQKPGQLNLFTGGKVVKLNQLSHFEEALMLDEQGRAKEAKAKYKTAIEEQDSLADAWCNLGILESQDGNYAKAIDCFTLCLKYEPRQYEAHYNLANLFSEAGNYGLAKMHYQISIELEPTFCNNYYNLGLTLALNKEFKDAVSILKQYRQIAPCEEHKHTDELISQLMNAL